MCKAKAEKRIRRKVAKAKPCPFCGKVPKFDICTDEKISDRGSFGYYAKMLPCCRVLGCGRTELFFTNNNQKPNFGLWANMAIRLINDWNRRTAGA